MKSNTSQLNLPFKGRPNGCHDDSDVQFGCSAQELSELLELDGPEAACRIRERYGGVGEICRHLKTSPAKGLSGSVADLRIRSQTFGSNAASSVHAMQSFLPLLWNATWDVTLGILIATVLVSFALSFVPREISTDIETEATDSASEWTEYVCVFVLILLIVLAIALTESFKQKWICATVTEDIRKCTVIRGGEYVEIPAREIVVGDVCDISYGNIVPASGFLIHGSGVRVKENLPDGSVQIVAKDVLLDPVVHSGSHVTGGTGRMVIAKVGPNSDLVKKLCVSFNLQNQKTKADVHDSLHSDVQKPRLPLLEEEHSDAAFQLKRKSALESKIRRLTVRLCYAGIAATVVLIVALIVRLSLKTFVGGRETSVVEFVRDFMRCLMLTAAVVVVIVPVRLPAGIVLVFAQALKRLLLEGNLVHHIGALESIGYVTDIITSKTGVITTNQASVMQLFVGGHVYKGLSAYHEIPTSMRSLLVKLISLSTEYSAQVEESQENSEKQIHRGDLRDCALLKFVLDLRQSYKAIRETIPYDHFVWISPFSSTRKFGVKVIPYENGGYQLLIKGAAEVVLSRCNWILDGDGSVRPFRTSDFEIMARNVLQPMSAAGLSTICLAFKNYVSPEVSKENEGVSSPEPNWEDEWSVVSNLTCVAIFGVENPLRDKLPKLLEKCRKFGVQVHLVTGESAEAARLVALKCGIIKDRNKFDVLEGKAFEAQIRRVPTGPIVPEYFESVWSKLGVVARSSPEDRLAIIRVVSEFLSKTRCRVIACTGKDCADVASMKKADIGFSMRNVGSDVTRETSDIILHHDGFSGIVRCIVWSHCIQENVRKLLQFQLTSVAVTFFTVMIGICVFNESPLQVTHLLWIKILLDLLGTTALTSEQPMEKCDCQPYTKFDSLFSRSVGKNVILHSLYQINVVLTLLFTGEYFMDMEDSHGHKHLKISPKYTAIFNTFILMMLFNEINARMLSGERNVFYQIYCNYAFLGTWMGSLIVQIFIVQFGGSVFSTVALTVEQWGWCLFFGVGELLWCQVIAFLPKCDACEKPANCRNDFQEMEQSSKALWEVEDDESYDDSHLGMILWKHGLTRLQNQLRVARAFKNILEASSELQSSRGSWPDLDLDDPSHRLPKHLQSFSMHNCFDPQLLLRERPDAHCHWMPESKSKSADNILYDRCGAIKPSCNLSDKMVLPDPGNDPRCFFSR